MLATGICMASWVNPFCYRVDSDAHIMAMNHYYCNKCRSFTEAVNDTPPTSLKTQDSFILSQ